MDNWIAQNWDKILIAFVTVLVSYSQIGDIYKRRRDKELTKAVEDKSQCHEHEREIELLKQRIDGMSMQDAKQDESDKSIGQMLSEHNTRIAVLENMIADIKKTIDRSNDFMKTAIRILEKLDRGKNE
ncbi:MAG: hypothetical protein ACLFQX_08235 [Candidatus Kapaibacterium sp.]